MFLLYPSRDFDIAITIIYVVFTQRELTVSTALVFAFSHHPRLEGGFCWYISSSQPPARLHFVLCVDVWALTYPVPTGRHLGCSPCRLCQRCMFFYTHVGLS